MTNIYTAIATASGRDGRAASSDGKLDVRPSPAGRDGRRRRGHQPGAAVRGRYAACFAHFDETGRTAAEPDVADASSHRRGRTGPINGAGGYKLKVTLRVELPNHITPQAAEKLLETTHQVCPYSNATRGNIPVDIVID